MQAQLLQLTRGALPAAAKAHFRASLFAVPFRGGKKSVNLETGTWESDLSRGLKNLFARKYPHHDFHAVCVGRSGTRG